MTSSVRLSPSVPNRFAVNDEDLRGSNAIEGGSEWALKVPPAAVDLALGSSLLSQASCGGKDQSHTYDVG